MAFTNFDTKEINCKILYFGGVGSGKTENLHQILKMTSPDINSGLMRFDKADQPVAGLLEFLPISLGYVRFSFKASPIHSTEKFPL